MGEVVLQLRLGNFPQRIAPRSDGVLHFVHFDIAEHRGLDSAVGEVKAGTIRLSLVRPAVIAAVAMFDLRGREFRGGRISMGSETIDDWASGVAESQQLRNFVESLACGDRK